jgi:eukaryotic-like serine/threonine-protein kinase
MALDSDTKLGPYEILSALGAGGMGEVYRARDPRVGREVAIKVLPSGSAPDSERLRRFEHEARATAAINHPNILAVFDIGSQDNFPWPVAAASCSRKSGHRTPRGLSWSMRHSLRTANTMPIPASTP